MCAWGFQYIPKSGTIDVREVKQRILKNANAEQLKELNNDDWYGAPYSFWQDARKYNLCTEAEVNAAQNYYGSMWHYRGD